MIYKKSIQLTSEPMDELLKYGTSIDFRLDEKRWEDLKVDDLIEFWEDFSGWDKEPSQNSRRVPVKILGIFRARSFRELLDDLPDTFVEREDKDTLIKGLRRWWTAEKEKQIGVLGLKIDVLEKE